MTFISLGTKVLRGYWVIMTDNEWMCHRDTSKRSNISVGTTIVNWEWNITRHLAWRFATQGEAEQWLDTIYFPYANVAPGRRASFQVLLVTEAT